MVLSCRNFRSDTFYISLLSLEDMSCDFIQQALRDNYDDYESLVVCVLCKMGYVPLSFSPDSAHFREIDNKMAEK